MKTAPGHETLNAYYRRTMLAEVKQLTWYRTAPAELRRKMRVKLDGVKLVKFAGLMSSRERPAMIISCTIGEETVRFCMALDGVESVQHMTDN